jgi:hypothetical protein
MSPGHALSRDSCPAKTTSAKARKIKNSTKNGFLKKLTRSGNVAMSELSNGTKKHTSKSRETIPLRKIASKICESNPLSLSLTEGLFYALCILKISPLVPA